VYVNGDISVANKSDVYGVIVAAGSIDILNRFDQFPPSNAVPTWWVDAFSEQYGSNWPSLLAGGAPSRRFFSRLLKRLC